MQIFKDNKSSELQVFSQHILGQLVELVVHSDMV